MSQQRSGNAVSGKTARACDSCLRRRARWYCAADDAFLCQACDSLVHSANPLARRHDRVRLKTSSSYYYYLNSALPAWHQLGFKRKARTPRHAKSSTALLKPMLLVPDLEALADENMNINNDNNINEEGAVDVREEEEQLLYHVPIFDPVLIAEFSSPPPAFDETDPAIEEERKPATKLQLLPAENQSHGIAGFNPLDMELADEFAADVENLLGQGLDDDSFCIDRLGLLEVREEEIRRQVKMEQMDGTDHTSGGRIVCSNNGSHLVVDMGMEISRESLDFNFHCGSPTAGDDEVEEQNKVEDRSGQMKVGLRLDYEAVIAAWSFRGCSPWTDGERPHHLNLDYCCLPDFVGMWGAVGGGGVQGAYGKVGLGGQVGNGNGGREARVSRYREKRRTRLFSKKIRYQVRKLNAEKRPRMKGRFVKRASFPAAATAFPYG